MKIHSKNHDYYDTASAWQSDIHWQRPETTIEHTQHYILKRGWITKIGISDKYDSRIFVVGFCGKLYHGIELTNRKTLSVSHVYKKIPGLDIVNTHKLHAKYPIFIIEEHTWSESKLHINPILKDWGFYKVKDSFTAHQEIEQYLTNELANQQDGSDLVETEQQILERHGMNKCSFKGKFTGRKKND